MDQAENVPLISLILYQNFFLICSDFLLSAFLKFYQLNRPLRYANCRKNKAGYTATPVACGRAGAIFEVSGAFGQERYSQKTHKRRKSKV